jgi:hypothetical protein
MFTLVQNWNHVATAFLCIFLRSVRTTVRRRMGDGATAPRITTCAPDRSQVRDPCFGFSTHGEDNVTRKTGDREGHRDGLNAFEKCVCPYWKQNHDYLAHPASSLVTILTELSQVRRIDYKENLEPAVTKINVILTNYAFGRTNCLRPRKIINRSRWACQADSWPSPSHTTARAQKLSFSWRWRLIHSLL